MKYFGLHWFYNSLWAYLSSLVEPVRSPVEPVQDTSNKVPAVGAEEADRPMSAEQYATRVAALAASLHITKPSPTSDHHLRFYHQGGIRQC